MNEAAINVTSEKNELFEKYKYLRWLKVAIGMIVMFCIGICYAWSVFNAPIALEMGWTAKELSVTFTVFMWSNAFLGIVSGMIISKRKGAVWQNFLISGILLFSAFLVSANAHSLIVLYLGFGVLGGAGVVFAYNSMLTVVTRWFRDLLGLASGLLLMSYGLSSFLMGKLYSAIIATGAEWRTVFLWFGIALAVMLVLAAVLLVPPPEGYRSPDLRKPKIDKHPIQAVECTPLEMIRRPSFWCLFAMGTCLTITSMGITSNARYLILAVKADVSLGDISTIVGLISILNAAGRIFTGAINDWGGLRFNILISATSVVLTTALVGFAIMSGSLAFLVVSFILFGFASGMSAPDGAVVTQKFFGTKNYQINLQVVMFCGILNSLGAMIVSSIAESVGNFYVPVFVLAGIAVFGWIGMFFLRKP